MVLLFAYIFLRFTVSYEHFSFIKNKNIIFGTNNAIIFNYKIFEKQLKFKIKDYSFYSKSFVSCQTEI